MIKRIINYCPYGFKRALSKEDKNSIKSCSYWLEIWQSNVDTLSARKKINAFLLLLWLQKPTKTHVKIFFEKGKWKNLRIFHRLLDRFIWKDSEVNGTVTSYDLENINEYINNLLKIIHNKKRLNNSLVLTERGCFATDWQVAFICYTAASESLLTYSKDLGITKRLSKSYACLTESSISKRDEAYKLFKKSYEIRSDIMHGRAFQLNDPTKNLEELVQISNILRKLWNVILKSDEIINALEGDDKERQNFFKGIEKGYKTPY